MVMTINIKKYMTKIGQNTGMLKASKNVQKVATHTALVPEYLKQTKTIWFLTPLANFRATDHIQKRAFKMLTFLFLNKLL